MSFSICVLFIFLFFLFSRYIVPPSVRAIPASGQLVARKGNSVTLECKASGNPVPTIYWYKKVNWIFFFSIYIHITQIQIIYILFFFYFLLIQFYSSGCNLLPMFLNGEVNLFIYLFGFFFLVYF